MRYGRLPKQRLRQAKSGRKLGFASGLHYLYGLKNAYMEELTLTTPALLFSAVSLILLAYTNRFLSYAQLVRTLKDQYLQNHSKVTRAQIDNLRRRLHLTRTMQILGVTSLFFCVITMFLIYIGFPVFSVWVFGAALLLLIGSLGVSIWEIQISVRALDIHLRDMEN